MSLPIAVQLYSVRDEAEADLFGTLEKIKEMGYDGVELAGLYGHSPSDVKEYCDKLNLTPISAHVPYYDMIADPQRVLSDYAEIGCKYVAIPYLTPELRPGTDRFCEVVKNAEMLGNEAKKLGMTLLYHNHDFEFAVIDGKYALDILYDSVPEDVLQTEIDTCWVKVAGEDPAAYVLKYKGRAPIVHLKDYVGDKSENMYALIGIDGDAKKSEESSFGFRPVGKGCQDMKKIIASAEKADSLWLVVEQDEPEDGVSRLDSVRQSIEYLKSL